MSAAQLPRNAAQRLRRFPRSAGAALAVGLAACRAEDPWPQVLVVVDTDVPVPKLASRLRIDLYDAGGRWYDSQDFPRSEPTDWPTSFSLYSEDESQEREVLVRLRAYPEGKLRSYAGERYRPRPTFVGPKVAHDLEELCTDPPRLELGRTLTIRRGPKPIIPPFGGGDCDFLDMDHGSAAAYFDVTELDTYRIAVVKTRPYIQQVSLQLRRTCDDYMTKIDCSSGIVCPLCFEQVVVNPQLDVQLLPGRYYLLTGGKGEPGQTADVTIGFTRLSEWHLLVEPEQYEVLPPTEPRLVKNGEDATPDLEPQPNVTIDRLVAVRIGPETSGATQITLHGACLGTMAKLSSAEPFQQLDLAEAETCVDVENQRVPVADAPVLPTSSLPVGSEQGAFGSGQAPCPPSVPGASRICVEGGTFILGSPEFSGLLADSSAPERVAVVPTFWIDPNEVTLARYGAALEAGFYPGEYEAWSYEVDEADPWLGCPWQGPARDFGADAPLSCVPWDGARAFCQFYGGDLPTEAQWEYLGAAAGRPRETRFPWGDALPRCIGQCGGEPDCHEAIFGYGWSGVSQVCGPKDPSIGEYHTVMDAAGPNGDVLLLPTGGRVIGMAGSVAEWTLDSHSAFGGDCWAATPLVSPACWEEVAPERTARGGAFAFGSGQASVASRVGYGFHRVFVGFRCVYPNGSPE